MSGIKQLENVAMLRQKMEINVTISIVLLKDIISISDLRQYINIYLFTKWIQSYFLRYQETRRTRAEVIH